MAYRILALPGLILLLVTGQARAQTDPNGGIVPFSTHEFGIDLATGNITTTIPVRNKTGKIPFSYAIVSSSHAFIVPGTSTYATAWKVTTGFTGAAVEPYRLLGASLLYTNGAIAYGEKCTSDAFYSNLAVMDNLGTIHPFYAQVNVCSTAEMGGLQLYFGELRLKLELLQHARSFNGRAVDSLTC